MAQNKLINRFTVIKQIKIISDYFGIGVIASQEEGSIVYICEKCQNFLKNKIDGEIVRVEQLLDLLGVKQSEYENIKNGLRNSISVIIDNQKINLKASIIPEKNNEKLIVFLLIEEAYQAVRQDDKLNFLSIISHEFRTPISVIENIFELFNEEVVGPISEKQKGLLTIGKSNVSRLLKMLNDLLDVAKMEHERIDLNLSLFDSKELILKIVNEATPEIQKKSVVVSLDIEDNSITAFGDEARIKQAINNIVVNAIKFTKSSTEVAITAKIINKDELENIREGASTPEFERYLLFTCHDEGVGIDDVDIEKIFGSFTQVEEVNTRKFGGQGVGLAIAKYFIERHFGYIWVKSEKNKGSTFTVVLPEITNHNQMTFALSEKIASASFYGYPLSIVCVDLKEFPNKEVFNSSGIKVFVLAKRLIEKILFRSYDFVHFDSTNNLLYVILVNCKMDQAENVADRICKTIKSELSELSTLDIIPVSILSYPKDGTTVKLLIDKSLENMGRIKSENR